MEKHKCKLCLRSFANGRALGGHMRSHMMNLPLPPKPNEFAPVQLSFEAESSSPSSSSFEQEKSLSYGLRENPKRSSRFADPEFSFPADTSSVILQDRESETESSKKPTRKRSKRTWKLGKSTKITLKQNESASSASDTTTEEDVAFCLMMLSRDKWMKHEDYEYEEEEESEEEKDEDDDDDDDDDDSDESKELKSKKSNKARGRYKCETCDKVFRSYQALGGHRASHKKIKVVTKADDADLELELEPGNNGGASSASPIVVAEKKIHQCPVCFRVFASGQALGGHKRTHVIGSATAATTATAIASVSVRTSTKFGDSLIDLNLPAPVDDDDNNGVDGNVSQLDDSAVSDAEFVKSH